MVVQKRHEIKKIMTAIRKIQEKNEKKREAIKTTTKIMAITIIIALTIMTVQIAVMMMIVILVTQMTMILMPIS